MDAHFQHESSTYRSANKPYVPPMLKFCGTVASLTASGSDGSPEQSGNDPEHAPRG